MVGYLGHLPYCAGGAACHATSCGSTRAVLGRQVSAESLEISTRAQFCVAADRLRGNFRFGRGLPGQAGAARMVGLAPARCGGLMLRDRGLDRVGGLVEVLLESEHR